MHAKYAVMKRALYIFGVFLFSLLLVLIMLVAVLTSSRVQTAAVQWVTGEFAEALGTNAHIGEVQYHFPARVSIHDIYLEDQHQDTLLYIDEVYVHFRPLSLFQNEIRFSHAHASNAVSKIYRQDGEWNYQFLVDGLGLNKKDTSESSASQMLVAIHDIQFDSIRLQYEDYHVLLAKASMELNELNAKSLDAQINRLALQIHNVADPSLPPFIVDDLSAHIIQNDSVVSLPTLKAALAQSRMDMSGIEVHFPSNDSLSATQAAHEITFAVHFREADIIPADLALFIPKIKGLIHPISLHGDIGGTLDSLFCDDITVQYDGHPFLDGDVCITGLPDMENTYLRANLKEIQTNAARIQDFLSQLHNRPTRLPQGLHRLGHIQYHGLLEGQLHDLTLHGGFRTALGTITTDGTLVSDSSFAHMEYDARIVGRQFNLGRLLDKSELGSVTLDLSSKGLIENGKVYGDIFADVQQLTYNDYTFSDLHFDGRYEPQQYRGQCAIDDPHIKVDFDGVVNLRDKNPEINFNLLCHHFDLSPFSDEHANGLETSFALAVDMDGTQLDLINGYMVIDSLALTTDYDSMLMEQLTLVASAAEDHSKSISLNSDNLHIQADGVFRYADLVPAFESMLHHYLPSVMPEPATVWSPVSLSLRAEGERLRQVQRLFEAPITISDHTTMAADIALSPSTKKQPFSSFVDMRFYAPGVRANGTPIHDLLFQLRTEEEHLALSVAAELDNTQMTFATIAFQDTLISHLIFNRELQQSDTLLAGLRGKELYQAQVSAQRDGKYNGDIQFITHFAKYDQQPLVELHFMPTEFLLRDSVYRLTESQLTYCAAESSLQIENFSLFGAGQGLEANGMASAKSTDTLHITMQALDASYVVPFVLSKQIIEFNGLMTGEAEITGLFAQPLVETMIHIDSMGLNNCYFGEAEVDLHVFPIRHMQDTILPAELRFHADVNRPDRRVVALDGEANFTHGGWKLDMWSDRVPLQFINHWTYSVLDSLDGYGTGSIVVGDDGGGVYVLLRQLAQEASLTIPWTNARYTIARDSIIMDTTAIRFPNVHLTDAHGNAVELDGKIRHNQFESYALDLHVDSHDALVYDSHIPGENIQGTVFATGHVDVTGTDQDIVVAVNATTSNKSQFRYSLDNMSSASESNFIHFVEHPSLDTTKVAETDLDNIDIQVKPVRKYYVPSGRCLLKMNLDVNPQLLFQLVLSDRTGDMIQARGNGALSLRYDTQSEEVSLLGTYDISQGSFTYTVANVIHKDFTIGEGSTIVFSGNPSNPQMDITAKYRVTANLRDLFGDDANQLTTSRSNVPVLTCLQMTGRLNNPILSFSLEFPMSDQAIQQQVRQVINTDEMLMKQVIYLLVFGRFYTPDNLNNAQYTTLNSTYSLLSSTVTGQINNWLSKLTNRLTLGVAVRVDETGGNTSQEYEAQFQLQPVDRLVINGNFGYRYNDISNQPFFGDLDVEVLITEDGQWRLKGYTHTVDKYSLRQASTIQGVGFMWKKDF